MLLFGFGGSASKTVGANVKNGSVVPGPATGASVGASTGAISVGAGVGMVTPGFVALDVVVGGDSMGGSSPPLSSPSSGLGDVPVESPGSDPPGMLMPPNFQKFPASISSSASVFPTSLCSRLDLRRWRSAFPNAERTTLADSTSVTSSMALRRRVLWLLRMPCRFWSILFGLCFSTESMICSEATLVPNSRATETKKVDAVDILFIIVIVDCCCICFGSLSALMIFASVL
mmetsp:Transcript_16914/g.34907  ORF Transcript_16914/g.34907 Transcript_16914/m.34907 type:complete len:231 (+) Transcript_16914:531-1223(+)